MQGIWPQVRTVDRRNGWRYAALVALMSTWMAPVTGCDVAPSPLGRGGEAPVLHDFSMSPQRVVFEELPNDWVIADTLARVPVRLSVRVDDPDGDLETVTFTVRPPWDTDEPYRSGTLEAAIGNRYDRTVTLDMPRGGVGGYEVLVYAVDAESRLSNQVRATLRFEVAQGSPPVITAIDAPSTFRPPGELRLIAVVFDADGLSNIRGVFVRTPAGAEVPMFDDGATSGDESARDGRYTASFNVPGASPGPQTFQFRAVDRSGLVSETVEWTITIES